MVGMPFALHLVDKRSHAIDTGIARRDNHHRVDLRSQLEGLLGPLAFLLHARVNALASRSQIGFYELKIILVAYHYVGLSHGVQYGGRDVFFAARSYACYDNLSHDADKDTKINSIGHQYNYLFAFASAKR